jgi:hypothetical protein
MTATWQTNRKGIFMVVSLLKTTSSLSFAYFKLGIYFTVLGKL